MEESYFDLISDEIILEILEKLPTIQDVVQWCLTTKGATRFCQDDLFWGKLYRRRFGFRILNLDLNWKEKYRLMLQIERNTKPFSVGHNHYGIIDNKLDLYMAGNNTFGQLGKGDDIASQILVKVKGQMIEVSGGFLFTGAIDIEGNLYLWGMNMINSSAEKRSRHSPNILYKPRIVPSDKKIIKLTTGHNNYGLIFDNLTAKIVMPENSKSILLPMQVIDLDSFGLNSVAAIDLNGKVHVWTRMPQHQGDNSHHHVISIPSNKSNLPIKVIVGAQHAVILSQSGNVYTWGSNYNGQLGIPRPQIYLSTNKAPLMGDWSSQTNRLILVNLPNPAIDISAGMNAVSVVDNQGKLYMWGSTDVIKNSIGAGAVARTSPIDVIYDKPVELSIKGKVKKCKLSDNGKFALALMEDKTVKIMGDPDQL